MIAIIDFGAGNLGSVYKALRYIGADVRVSQDAGEVRRADALVLPGVGAFSHCMQGLAGVRLTDATLEFIRSGRPFLGICVGLQMLFDASEEMGASPGLGVLPGRVVRFNFDAASGRHGDAAIPVRTLDFGPRTASGSGVTPSPPHRSTASRLKVPHIGWNELSFRQDAALFRGLNQGDRVYFVHSYYPCPEDEAVVTATTEYGYPICAAVQKDNVHATQFHPEKSGAIGLRILRNFASLAS